MGKRSARRRKAAIKTHMAEHKIGKYTEAARVVDGSRTQAAARHVVLGGFHRGGEGKSSAEVPFLPFDMLWKARKGDPLTMPAAAVRLDRVWNRLCTLAKHRDVIGSGRSSGDADAMLAEGLAWGTASLVLDWLVQSARSEDPARVSDWLASRGRVLSEAQYAVLERLLGDPGLRRDRGRPVTDADSVECLQWLDAVLAASGPDLAARSGADGATGLCAAMLLARGEAEPGPIIVDSASAEETLRWREVWPSAGNPRS
ncbi:hypothetical protein [Amycolatopsis sp. NPDC004079]|uniref:hypothetical protein n=1 Tax=Amycolatopsis sp. NPDC004079 TaxID=3154549 RepID=UPI0033A2090C